MTAKYLMMSCVFLTYGSLHAQKAMTDKEVKNAVKTIKANIKGSTKLDESVKMVNDILRQERLAGDCSYYDLAGNVQKAIYDAENRKLYLKQKYDTLKLYEACYSMFDMYMKCDSIERSNVKQSYRKKNFRELTPLRPNLLFIGKDFHKRRRFVDAIKFFDLYTTTATNPLFSDADYARKDTLLEYADYLSLESAVQISRNDLILRHTILAENDSRYGEFALEHVARAYDQSGDTVRYVEALENGIRRFPKNPYFFANLVDYYNMLGNYDGALDYARSMVERDSLNAYYHFVEGYVLQNMERYDDAIASLEKSYAIDSLFTPSIRSLGYCYFQKASAMYSNLFQNRQKGEYRVNMEKLYMQSMRYYENLRKKYPERTDVWYDFLYTIYYRLNKGKELEELER